MERREGGGEKEGRKDFSPLTRAHARVRRGGRETKRMHKRKFREKEKLEEEKEKNQEWEREWRGSATLLATEIFVA